MESTASEVTDTTSKKDLEKTALEHIQKSSLEDVEATTLTRQGEIAKTFTESSKKTSQEDAEEATLKEQELSFRKEIFKEEMQAGVEAQSTLERKHLSFDERQESMTPALDEVRKQERIDQQIRSEIFSHELDEAIEAEPLEVTYLSGASSIDEKSEQFVEKRMKSDILSQELAQGPDDQSPEQKDLPRFPLQDLRAMDHRQEAPLIVTPTRSASEIPAETVLWEVPVQEQGMQDTTETTEEIPAHRQVIVERDEEEDEESEPDTANIEDVEQAMLADSRRQTNERLSAEEAREIAEGIVEDIKTEVCRRPPLRHIPSEISEEDLVERFGGSPEQDFVGGRQMSEDRRTKFVAAETSSVDITDEELQASSDELSPVEQHRERLESLTIEENFRRQSFVQLAEEHDLLAETEWKASKWKEDRKEAKDETFRLMETSPLVDEILSKGAPVAKEGDGKERAPKVEDEELLGGRDSREQGRWREEDHSRSEEARSATSEEERRKEEEEHFSLFEESRHSARSEEERSEKFEERVHSRCFEERTEQLKGETVRFQEEEHASSFQAMDKEELLGFQEDADSFRKIDKEQLSKFQEEGHSSSFEKIGKEHLSKFQEEERASSSQTMDKEQLSKLQEDDYSSYFQKMGQSKFHEDEHSSSSQAMDKERLSRFHEEEHSSSFQKMGSEEHSSSSLTMDKEQVSKLQEDDHSSHFQKMGKMEQSKFHEDEHSSSSQGMDKERLSRFHEDEHSSSSQAMGKERLSKFHEEEHFQKMDEEKQSKFHEDEHSSSSQGTAKEQLSRFHEDEHSSSSQGMDKEQLSKFDEEEHFQKMDKEQQSKFHEAEHSSSSQAMDKERLSRFHEEEHFQKLDEEHSSSSQTVDKEQLSKLREDDHASHFQKMGKTEQSKLHEDERSSSSQGTDKEQLSKSHEEDHSSSFVISRQAPPEQEEQQPTQPTEDPEYPRFVEHEVYSLEKDRERRAKQEQEFQEVVKLRREQVEQARSREVAGSSSGSSHYSSAVESETPATSRPCSSDVDTLLLSGDYDTCATSSDGTYRTAPTSQEYVTAGSSIDSESSGHLGSVEVSSEASETLVPSALELERDAETPTVDDERFFQPPVKEPYETEIPQHVIRGAMDTELGSPFEVIQEAEVEGLFGGAMRRQESGAYLAAECVDDLPRTSCAAAGLEALLLEHPMPVASAPPAEDEDGYMADVYSQANGPVEVEFFPEYDQGPDDGFVAGATPDIVPAGPDPSDDELSEDEAPPAAAKPDSELDLGSRPQSHAESDSEQRPQSELQFSDDRPDSELTELMRQADAPEGREELERPASPEPLDEYDFEERKSAAECPEKHELETSERSAKDKAVDIPDITVTQHTTPMAERRRHFPDYEDEEEQAAEEDRHKTSMEKEEDRRKTSIQKHTSMEKEEDSAEEDSGDSFEMVEKSDVRREDDDEEDGGGAAYSAVSVRPLGVHYYPDEDGGDAGEDGGASEDGGAGSYEKGEFEQQEKEEQELDAEKWMELQFEAEAAPPAGYQYQMEFEREYEERAEFYPRDEELEDIAEEGEKQDEEEDEKAEAAPPRESKSSTPDYDFVGGRRFFSRSGDNDDVSMSSLQEFERIEAELARGDRRLSAGSQDSLNGKRSAGDGASVTSLQEFERLERECLDAERIERLAREEAARLSEIEEGHESQASEAESQETLSEHGGDDTDSDDYEKRMFEIDEIIKQAQSNVEQFVAGAEPAAAPSSGDATESSLLDKTPDADADSLDGGGDAKDDCDSDSLQEEEEAAKAKASAMASSTDSLEPSSATATHATYQYETDSIMSSSFTSMQTSAEESTMVSSADTFDLEQRANRESPPQDPRTYIEQALRHLVDAEGNVQTDAEGNRTLHRAVMLEPEVRTVTFAGPDAEAKMQEFIARFQPGDDVLETETTDAMGNVHVTRTVQHRLIMQPQVTTVSFTGPEAERKIQEYLSQAGADMPDSAQEEETEAFESTDQFGNVRRVVRKRGAVPSGDAVSFSGPDAQRRMEDFLQRTIEGFEPGGAAEETTTRDRQGNAMKVVRHVVGSAKTDTSHKATLPDFGSPRRSPLLRESPPSSPTVSSSSHSEDCYCGPEAETSAHGASLGPHRPEIEELETESWDPQRRAEFYSEEGDYGVEEEDEELNPATATATRVVSHEVRRTVRGPNGEDIVVVESEDSYEDHPGVEQLRQASKQIVELDEDEDSQAHHHQDS